MTITPAQLEEWKRLAEAATPGEWTQRLANDGTGDRGIKAPSKRNVIAECFADMDYDGERALSGCKANAAFIAASRTALPALIAEVERLRAEAARLEGEKSKLREALSGAVQCFDNLMSDSGGVYGLHLNSDPTPWNEPTSDNHFEDWTTEIDDARLALAETGEKP